MELTTKHLAAYLPYGLKVSNSINFADFGICQNTTELLQGYSFGNVITDKDEFGIEYCILHLRPLSDLTKEITINGETFVPMLELLKIAINDFDDNEGEINAGMITEWELHDLNITAYLNEELVCKLLYNKSKIKFTFISPQDLWWSCSYSLMEKLLEWHFDIFGLLENNLAININEINNL